MLCYLIYLISELLSIKHHCLLELTVVSTIPKNANLLFEYIVFFLMCAWYVNYLATSSINI